MESESRRTYLILTFTLLRFLNIILIKSDNREIMDIYFPTGTEVVDPCDHNRPKVVDEVVDNGWVSLYHGLVEKGHLMTSYLALFLKMTQVGHKRSK